MTATAWPASLPPADLLGARWGTDFLSLPGFAAGAPSVLSIDDVIGVVADGRARFPHVVVLEDGRPADPRRFAATRPLNADPGERTRVSQQVDIAAVTRALAGGASLQLNNVQEYCPPVAALCGALGERCGLRTAALAFLSPPGRGAFTLHQDPVHVIVVQTEGTKDWEVFEQFPGQDAAGPVGRPAGAAAAHIMTLRPGDLFYMPPRRPHQARSSDSWSLHVSVIARPYTVAELLRPRLEAALTDWEHTPVEPGWDGAWAAVAGTVADAGRRLAGGLDAWPGPDLVDLDEARRAAEDLAKVLGRRSAP